MVNPSEVSALNAATQYTKICHEEGDQMMASIFLRENILLVIQ